MKILVQNVCLNEMDVQNVLLSIFKVEKKASFKLDNRTNKIYCANNFFTNF